MIMYIIGFLAQVFFFSQNSCSMDFIGKSKEGIVTLSFWILSIAGSYLLFIYGWMREDFSILLGQFLSYYYLHLEFARKGYLGKINILLKIALIITPVIAIILESSMPTNS